MPCVHGNKRSQCRECWRISRKASRDRAKARKQAFAKIPHVPLATRAFAARQMEEWFFGKDGVYVKDEPAAERNLDPIVGLPRAELERGMFRQLMTGMDESRAGFTATPTVCLPAEEAGGAIDGSPTYPRPAPPAVDRANIDSPPPKEVPVSTKTHRCGWCGKRDAKKGRGMIPHPRSGAIGLWCEKCVP